MRLLLQITRMRSCEVLRSFHNNTRRFAAQLPIRMSVAILALIVGTTSAFGQTIAGFGEISGVVKDQTGAVVPGAQVVLDNGAKGIHRELETTGAGVFEFAALIPSSGYSITVKKEGFSIYTVKNIIVTVGEGVTLTAPLTVSTSATEVSVTAETESVDQTKVSTSTVVNSTQILDLPINGRRVDSFVLLTPGVANDAAFGLLTFRGNPGGNSFLTDGSDTTNSFYDENAGRTRTYNIAQDAVQEFQVVSSNFLAEYGHASGGVVNTITRSGSNSIHGTAYEFFRNRTLNATDATTNGVNPPEWRHQAGLSIGGPAIKDKLFYFFNGELTRRNAPIVSSDINNGLFDASGKYEPINPNTKQANCLSGGAGQPTAAQCAAAIAYVTSRAQIQLVPRSVDDNLLFGKLDYHPDSRNSFAFSSNYLDFRSPNGIQTQLSLTGGNGIGNNANTTVFDRTGNASWTFVASPTALNEFRFGYFKDRQADPASPSLLPSLGPIALSVASVSNLAYANGYPRIDPSEQRFELSDTFSWTRGKHNLKYGVDWDHVEDYVSRLANQFGTYSYNTLQAFALDFSGTTTGKHWASFSQTTGNGIVDTGMPEISLFVQDEWHVSPKLTISPGIRYEHSWIPQPASVGSIPQTGTIPNNGLDLAPRLGIAYALNEKTSIRTGYGIFYNRFTTSAIENLFVTNGVYQPSFFLSSSGTTGPTQVALGPVFPNRIDPSVLASTSFQASIPPGVQSVLYADPNWRNPYSQQADLGIQRELARNTTLDVSYVWSRSLHLQGTKLGNLGNPSSSATYNILDASGNVAGTYTTPVYLRTDLQGTFNQYELQSGGNSFYNGLLVDLRSRYSDWFQGDVAYTYSHTIDDGIGGAGTGILFGNTFPTSYANGFYRGDRGSATTDQRHRLTVNTVVAPTFTHRNDWTARYLVNGWQLSVISVAAASAPLEPTISINSSNTPVANMFSTSTLNGLGGSFRVPFESTSALNIGAYYKTDARIAKQFPIGERVRLNLGFEAFNIFNHLIVEGSSPRNTTQYTAVKSGSVVNLVPNPQYGSILQTQQPPDGTTARRAQAVVRIVW